MNPKKILRTEAVIFDLDDTLYPENEYVVSAYREISNIVAKDFNQDSNEIFHKLMSFRKEHGDSNVLQRLMGYLGKPHSVSYIHDVLVPAYRNCECNLNLLKDAKELLEILEGKVLLGIITNGGSYTQRNKIRLLNIENKFDSIIITGEHFTKEFWKPDSKPFELCINQLNINPSKGIYVGNNPRFDVNGAHKVGLNVFIRNLEVMNEDKASHKYISITSLLDLLNYIDFV